MRARKRFAAIVISHLIGFALFLAFDQVATTSIFDMLYRWRLVPTCSGRLLIERAPLYALPMAVCLCETVNLLVGFSIATLVVALQSRRPKTFRKILRLYYSMRHFTTVGLFAALVLARLYSIAWPLAFAVLIFLQGLGGVHYVRKTRRRALRILPHCPACNYCLIGARSAFCPECGWGLFSSESSSSDHGGVFNQ